ncbi:MAG: membrane dipeptidase [Clostridia bacterium]
MSIPFADLHCDTITKLYDNNSSLKENNYNISLNKCEEIRPLIQTFAIFLNDDLKNADEYFDNSLNYFEKEVSLNNDTILHCKNFKEIETTIKSKRNAALLSIENAGVFSNPIAKINSLKNKGLFLTSLTWNDENKLAGGVNSDTGLTKLGKEFLDCLKENSIIPDVSHLNSKSFLELCSYYNGPIIASHSNSNKICENKRNLTDEQIVEIFLRDGLIGINLYSQFLTNDDKSKIDDIYKQIEHLLSLGGEDNIAFGCDFDGMDSTPTKINDISDVEKIFDYLLKKGYSNVLISKLFFNNVYNFLKRNK